MFLFVKRYLRFPDIVKQRQVATGRANDQTASADWLRRLIGENVPVTASPAPGRRDRGCTMPEPAEAIVLSGTAFVAGEAAGEIVASDVELSFWGGVDPASGEVIDRHHPLSGRGLAGKVLALPGGRGSCSGSGVVLELVLAGKAPAAILIGREDEIITLGVVVAQELFGRSIPVLMLGSEDLERAMAARHARVRGNRVALGEGPLTGLAAMDDVAPQPVADRIRLTEADRQILEGGRGRAAEAAMRIVLRMAELAGADRLMDVTRAHIDGCVYTGPGTLAFARRLRDWGGRVCVPTTLNALSVDHRRWRSQGVDPAFGEPAQALGDAYLDMGAEPTFTCAPYLLDDPPARGEQIAWAESNAVVYANSVLGARTMKYPDYLDICIALTGRAPHAGCHVAANRHAVLRIDLPRLDPLDDALWALIGYHCGLLAGHRIPVLTGLERTAPSPDDLKAFGAAFATTSSAPMFHILGVTPEAATLGEATGGAREVPAIAVTVADLARSWNELDGGGEGSIDLVSLGNPHFSLEEYEMLAALARGRARHPDVAVIVTAGRATHERAVRAGLVAELERFGVDFVTDTCWCMIGEPVIAPDARTIMTNSGKYAHYGPGLTGGRRLRFGSLGACVEAACTGRAPGALPPVLAPQRQSEL
jgi:predicted aconitase/predicted aconitase with swiveling domain